MKYSKQDVQLIDYHTKFKTYASRPENSQDFSRGHGPELVYDGSRYKPLIPLLPSSGQSLMGDQRLGCVQHCVLNDKETVEERGGGRRSET